MGKANEKTPITNDLEENVEVVRTRLGIGVSFDVLEREVDVGHRKASLFFVDGFVKDKVTQDLIRRLQEADRAEIVPNTVRKLLEKTISYFEIDTVETIEDAIDQVLSGPIAIFVDGERTAIIVDVRQYPVRGVQEPDLERVTRGSHEGLVETIIFNTALIRRRLRDPHLRFEAQRVGRRSQTDIAVGYIKDLADPDLVETVKERIAQATVDALPMGAKNLEEILVKQPWNPIPRVRYTERPDVVAAHLLEGHVVVLVDTTPMAILVPVTLFHFFEHAEEFFQSPTVGTYLRIVRAFAFATATLLTPLWLALYLSGDVLPPALDFIGPKKGGFIVPVPVQFLLLEFGLDLIRMALIHTPNALATSLGIVGAVLLGELAVQVGLFIPETILYAAVAAVGYFAVPSLEFGYAARFLRYFLLASATLFQLPGVLAGVLIAFLILARTRSIATPYLWPLIPFHGPSLVKALFRLPVGAVTKRPPILGGKGADSTRTDDSKRKDEN